MSKKLMSEATLIKRVNRKLRHDGYAVRVARERCQITLGHHYVVDVVHNFIRETDVDLETLARDTGAFDPEWEQLAS